VAWETKGCCGIVVAARLLDGDALAGASGELTLGGPTRPGPCN